MSGKWGTHLALRFGAQLGFKLGEQFGSPAWCAELGFKLVFEFGSANLVARFKLGSAPLEPRLMCFIVYASRPWTMFSAHFKKPWALFQA